jgi:hypothetical protein
MTVTRNTGTHSDLQCRSPDFLDSTGLTLPVMLSRPAPGIHATSCISLLVGQHLFLSWSRLVLKQFGSEFLKCALVGPGYRALSA